MLYDDMYDDEALQEMMAQYGDYEYDDYPEYSRVTLRDMLSSCMIPTITQTLQMLFPLYLLSFAFRMTLFLGGTGKSENYFAISVDVHVCYFAVSFGVSYFAISFGISYFAKSFGVCNWHMLFCLI